MEGKKVDILQFTRTENIFKARKFDFLMIITIVSELSLTNNQYKRNINKSKSRQQLKGQKLCFEDELTSQVKL
jgi:hypothetical protein